MNPIGTTDTGVGTPVDEKAPEPHHFVNPDAPVVSDIEKASVQDADAASVDVFAAMVAAEVHHDIKFKTLSWQKTAVLLFGEYVCLAITAQAWSFSVLGYVGGILVTLVTGMITWYTSYVLWQYCMKHPGEIKDICDVGYLLFGRSKVAYEITAIMLLLNNLFLMGFHIFTGSKILNTLSDHSLCTNDFLLIVTAMGIICSIPRTLKHVSYIMIVSAVCMFVSILLGLIFIGIEDHPGYGYGGSYPTLGEVYSLAVSPSGTTFVDGVNAMLNITFLWIGQILYPSFIAEMERPQDFPKALTALTIAEFILFVVPAIVGYRYLGQYATAPYFGSIDSETYRKISFGVAIVPTVLIVVVYANVANKYLFSRIMRGSRHAHSNSVIGWGVWLVLMTIIWFISYIFGSVIPSMGDFLSIMSAAFDSFFGSLFWVVAYYSLNRGRLFSSPKQIALTAFNVLIGSYGLFMLGPGLYTSIEAIILDYSGPVKHPFSCVNNAL